MTGAMTRAASRRRRASGWAVLLVLFLVLGLVLAPFLVVTMNALKDAADYSNRGPLALPQHLTLDVIRRFWERVDFGGKLWNSFVISGSVAVLATLFALPSAFALGIGRLRGRAAYLVIFIVANTLPHEALAYPLYTYAKALGLYDTRLAVIIVFTVIQGAFGTYLLSSVLGAFPRELVEAALVDGCTKLQLLVRVVAPVSLPTLAVLFTFFFIWTWNEFFLPLVLLVSGAHQTVPIAVSMAQGQHNVDATMASASALLGFLPCIVFFLLFQRTLTRGITAGSVK
jgi:raffinose/stachyose/melibiose transport system permease protein